ncbi:MAG: hypothetical protein O3B64_03790 [bacterium]|nr:hypothetical protein [bacterium]
MARVLLGVLLWSVPKDWTHAKARITKPGDESELWVYGPDQQFPHQDERLGQFLNRCDQHIRDGHVGVIQVAIGGHVPKPDEDNGMLACMTFQFDGSIWHVALGSTSETAKAHYAPLLAVLHNPAPAVKAYQERFNWVVAALEAAEAGTHHGDIDDDGAGILDRMLKDRSK